MGTADHGFSRHYLVAVTAPITHPVMTPSLACRPTWPSVPLPPRAMPADMARVGLSRRGSMMRMARLQAPRLDFGAFKAGSLAVMALDPIETQVCCQNAREMIPSSSNALLHLLMCWKTVLQCRALMLCSSALVLCSNAAALQCCALMLCCNVVH